MKNRKWNFSLLVSAAIFSLVCSLVQTKAAFAATTYQYGASVIVQGNNTIRNSGGWGSSAASQTVNDTYGNAYATAGFNTFSPYLSAGSNSPNPGYAKAIAGVDDYLTLTGSGSGLITIHLAGNWNVSVDPTNHNSGPWVRLDLNFTKAGSQYSNTYYAKRSLWDGGASKTDTAGWSGTWVNFTDGQGSSASGTYSFDLVTSVDYGSTYYFGLALTAEAPDGHSAYIDDPIAIGLPAGVTLASLSGSQYSPAPVPPSILLLAPGLIGLAAARRRFKK